jgi:serine/threonine protein kinase
LAIFTPRQPGDLGSTGAALEPDGDILRYDVNFDEYEPGGKLGRGAFGDVHTVRHQGTGQIWAVKELRPQGGNLVLRGSSEREVQILATLQSPAILSLHRWTPFKGTPHIVMPLMAASVEKYITDERNGAASVT